MLSGSEGAKTTHTLLVFVANKYNKTMSLQTSTANATAPVPYWNALKFKMIDITSIGTNCKEEGSHLE